MKKLFTACSLFFLIGCETPIKTNTDIIKKIKINNQIWSISLPEKWKVLSPNSKKQIIFSSQYQDQHFIITQQKGNIEDVPNQLLSNAKKDFHTYFNLVEKDSNQWKFQAQTKPENSKREYLQKIVQLPETNFFLLASCSFEVQSNRQNNCQYILDNWKHENIKK